MPRLVDGKGKLIAHAAERLGLKLDTASLRDMAGEIEWRKVSRLTLESYAQALPQRSLPQNVSPERALDLHAAYEDIKDERRQLDFEDVLLATVGMLQLEARVAQQVREQYRFFVVDEYQDVSPLQQELLELWLGDRNDLCVVGDASQTIYSFAGASADYLLGFGSRYDDATVVRLEQNYRSSRQIVDTANQLMRVDPARCTCIPPSRPPGPCRRSSSTRATPPRPAASRRRSPTRSDRVSHPRRSRCCTGSTSRPRRSSAHSPMSASRRGSTARRGSSSSGRSRRR